MLRKKWTIFSIAALIAFSVTACGSGDLAAENNEESSQNAGAQDLTGDSLEVSEESVEIKDIYFNGIYEEEDKTLWTFTDDGKLTVTEKKGNSAAFTYVLHGTYLVVSTSDGTTVKLKLRQKDNEYILTAQDGTKIYLSYVDPSTVQNSESSEESQGEVPADGSSIGGSEESISDDSEDGTDGLDSEDETQNTETPNRNGGLFGIPDSLFGEQAL